jgi:hypothetical protein
VQVLVAARPRRPRDRDGCARIAWSTLEMCIRERGVAVKFVRSLLAVVAAFAVGCNDSTGTTDEPDSSVDPMDTLADDASMDDPNALPDGAPDPCLVATNCADCTAQSPCGWCMGQCFSGTATSSLNGACSGAQWYWRGSQCPGIGAQCPNHWDCVSCAMDPDSCGWCSNVHRCVAGDRTGPADTSLTGCSPASGTWIYNLETMTCPP